MVYREFQPHPFWQSYIASYWFANLKGKVKVVKELNTTFYGTKEFAIEDVNGFILTFSERKDAE